MSDQALYTTRRRLASVERAAAIGGARLPDGMENRVVRDHHSEVPVDTLDGLMKDFDRRRLAHEWDDDRARSDQWLVPRVHFALKLFRAEASDRGLWQWVALRYWKYVEWRWGGDEDVTEDRWFGPIHKQAFARLWWGAEMFRDGSDYRPAVRAFFRQDLPNSYLHRPVVRCRSLALGILDVIAPAGREGEVSSRQVNDLARVLNLATTGSPPEAATGYQADDVGAYEQWVLEEGTSSSNWDDLPPGPPAVDTTALSVAGGREVALRGWGFATDERS